MEHAERIESADFLPGDAQPAALTFENEPLGAVTPQAASGSCPSCAGRSRIAPPGRNFFYGIGQVVPYLNTRSAESEFRQAAARLGSSTAQLNDREVFKRVMDDPKNRYLPAELFCWVMTVQRVETVILVPRRDWVIQDLIDTYSVDQDPRDIHVAIGTVSNQPVPPQCNQLQLPVVAVDQVYHSGRKDFLESIPVPSGADPDRFRDAAGQVFDQVLSQSDNAGFKDEDRVKNWALIKFGALYAAAAKAFADNCSFHSLEVLPSALGLGTRSIYDVVAGFRSRESGVLQKQYATVDASEVRPVLVSGFRPWVETRSWT